MTTLPYHAVAGQISDVSPAIPESRLAQLLPDGTEAIDHDVYHWTDRNRPAAEMRWCAWLVRWDLSRRLWRPVERLSRAATYTAALQDAKTESVLRGLPLKARA